MKGLILSCLLLYCGIGMAADEVASCCEDGELLISGGYCGIRSNTTRIPLNCTVGYMLLKDIILDGTKLSTEDAPNFVFTHDPNDYCVGEMNSSRAGESTVKVAVVCFQVPNENEKIYNYTGILSMVSGVFLVFTLMIYIFLPKLRDLQGMCFMCMCASMAIGFLSLGTLQFNPNFDEALCTATGYLLYFWMMATFFWMNVISIITYRTVCDATYVKRTGHKQFFFCSCYAWGASMMFLTVALITEFTEGSHWKPGIGFSSCWFNGNTETWIFFYGPLSVLILMNIGLFTLSSFKLWRESRKYEVSTLNILKYRFLLSLKLFLVMGIPWVFEVMSFAHGKSHIVWKIMDIFNSLQGLVIFLIFVVLRKKAIIGIAAHLSCCTKLTHLLAEKLNQQDDSEDEAIIKDEEMQVKPNLKQNM